MKITLTNTETGKNEEFEPVDAREVLATPDTIYKVLPDANAKVGLTLESSGTADINVPQLQGSDAELQTGASTQKYDRQAVVKAEPGDPDLNAGKADGNDAKAPAAKPSEGLTVTELKEALDKKGVAYPSHGAKAEYAELLDNAK